jgi:hypothetical protein
MSRARILADYVSSGDELAATTTVASAALPKAGGAMTGAITTNSTFDGIDVATRDAVLTSTTTLATAAAPKASPAFTGTPTGITAAHLEAGVLPSDVTGGSGLDAIKFLENNTSTQTLSGTYSTERLYFNDSYQLTGDVTVTGHLALGTIADKDVVITNDTSGTVRELSGGQVGGVDRIIEGGELLPSKETDLTGMTGELGSATFPAGHVVQVAYMEDGAVATGTTVFVDDDTIPQITEGIQFMTLSIIPKSATNKLMVDVIYNIIGSYTGGQSVVGAVFNTDFHATNALAASYNGVSNDYSINSLPIRFYVVAGTTSSTTFRFRGASCSPGTMTFNGRASAGKLGGVLLSSMTITEIQV